MAAFYTWVLLWIPIRALLLGVCIRVPALRVSIVLVLVLKLNIGRGLKVSQMISCILQDLRLEGAQLHKKDESGTIKACVASCTAEELTQRGEG